MIRLPSRDQPGSTVLVGPHTVLRVGVRTREQPIAYYLVAQQPDGRHQRCGAWNGDQVTYGWKTWEQATHALRHILGIPDDEQEGAA